MNQHLFLVREKPTDMAPMNTAEMQEMIASYQVWSQDLAACGLPTGGEKLTDDGSRQPRLIAGRPQATDGPYAEAHDVTGGIFTIQAESDAQAEELAMSCPHLIGSQWIEIRRIKVLG